MTYREKLQTLHAEMKALVEKVKNELSFDLEILRACAIQEPIEDCLRQEKTMHIRVHPVNTEGVRCVILSSNLYPEFGILVFDAPTLATPGGQSIELVRAPRKSGGPEFRVVCGCCSPHNVGVPKARLNNEQIARSFASATQETCRINGITHLLFELFDQWDDHPDGNPIMPQNIGGLRLHTSSQADFMSGIDQWRFAAAFGEIVIRGETAPFNNLFKVR